MGYEKKIFYLDKSEESSEEVKGGLTKAGNRIYYNSLLKYLKISGLSVFIGKHSIFIGPEAINDFNQLGITLIHDSIEVDANNIWYDLVDNGINW